MVASASSSTVRARFCAAFVAFAATLVAFSTAAAATLKSVRFGVTSPSETRVVLDIDGKANFVMAADPEGAGALIVDLARTRVDGDGARARKAGGLVAQYAYGRSAKTGARVVLTFAATAKVARSFVIPPGDAAPHARLVIDLVAADKKAFLASVPKRAPSLDAVIATAVAPEDARPPIKAAGPEAADANEANTAALGAPEAPSVAPSRQKTEAADAPDASATDARTADARAAAASPFRPQAGDVRPVVVIDPGHGGGDPGAEGHDGTKEKVLTLAAGLKLAEILRKTERYQVVLTRSDDTRLAPHQRQRLMREADPDLFISIHADAIKDKNVRGGTVYTLSQKGARRSAAEVLSDKNGRVGDLDIQAVDPTLGQILVDVAQRETLTESAKFADALIDGLKDVTPLVNNSHRKGNLRVLLAPDVPAVLLELAFISNRADLKNLKSDAWRKRTMKAVADAIDAYFAEKKRRAAALSVDGGGAG